MNARRVDAFSAQRIVSAVLNWFERRGVVNGLGLCKSGRHARLMWLGAGERLVPIPTTRPAGGGLNPIEGFYASGMGRFALWNGWCPRCGQAVEWADHDPIRHMRDGDALAAYEARNSYRRAQHAAKNAVVSGWTDADGKR